MCVKTDILSFFVKEEQTRVFVAVVEMLRWFAGHQVRNVAVSPDLSKVVKTSVASS